MSLIDDLLKKDPKVPVWGVVVGLPGPVDFASGAARGTTDHAGLERLRCPHPL